MAIDRRIVILLAVSAVLRLAVFVGLPAIPDFLTSRVEVSTPISSYKRLQEGIFLHERGLSPYDGGVFHQPPLLLSLFETLPAELVFVLLDIFNGLALNTIAEQAQFTSSRAERIDGFLLTASYLLNPFTIVSCLGRSTNALTNAAIIQAVSNAVMGNTPRSMLAIALAAYLSLYPALLLPPLVLLCWQRPQTKDNKINGLNFALRHLFIFAGGIAALFLTTPLVLSGSWTFMEATYGVQITVPDLTPNIGLWWYFFIEIFDAFRNFFIGVFWLLLVSYVGSLTLRLPKQPLFVMITLLGLFAIFKPYPSVSDVSLYLGFLPLYKYLLPLTRYTFIAASVLLYATLLGPAFHYVWIYSGSGNANFFYAITLVWSLGLTMLVCDTLFAALRDEFETERPEMKGKEVRQM